jgi:Ca2+-binding EF-hand superfamily protein
MKGRLFVTMAVILSSVLAAATDPTAADEEDVLEVVYLGDSGPVVLRLHLQGDACGAMTRWKEFVAVWFDYLDRDGDGRLSEAEFRMAPSPEQVREQWRSGLYPRLGVAGADFRAADTDRDGFVSRAELERYYRLGGAGPLTAVKAEVRDGTADALTSALFKLLDRDGDGRLSKAELANAAKVLRQVDANEDELIVPEELLTTRVAEGPPRAESESPLFVVMPGDRAGQAAELARALLKRYDRDGDGRLSAAEACLSPERFAALDTDGDKHLSATELAALLDKPADFDLVVRTGRDSECRPAKREGVANGREVSTRGKAVLASVPGARLTITALPPQTSLAAGVRQFFRQQFATADRAGRGAVRIEDVAGEHLLPLRTAFALADRDGDGRLTEREVERCVDLYARWLEVPVTLSVGGSRAGLFDLLDTNGDGRLSLRELMNAPRLLAFDRDGDGYLSRDKLPWSFELGVSTGPPGRLPAAGTPQAVADPDVPEWFRLMDRNGDGDVSPREFIGSAEEFRKLDLDGDGLISVAEAKAAEAARRKSLPKDK